MNMTNRPARIAAPALPFANDICYTCKCSLLTWITFLEDIESVSVLMATIQEACNKAATTKTITICCSNYQPDSGLKCAHLVDVAQLCQKLIREIPSFNTFVTKAT